MTSLVQLGAMAGVQVTNPEGSLESGISVMAGQAFDGWRRVDPDSSVPGPGGSAMPAAFDSEITPDEESSNLDRLAAFSGRKAMA